VVVDRHPLLDVLDCAAAGRFPTPDPRVHHVPRTGSAGGTLLAERTDVDDQRWVRHERRVRSTVRAHGDSSGDV
jgi:hypothetical protein